MAYTLRRAQTGDAVELTAIAHDAKAYWGYPARWIELWRDELSIDAEYIAHHEIFVAEENGASVAFYALTAAPKLAEKSGEKMVALDHLWVLPDAMGRGIGRALVEHAMQRARQLGAGIIEVESDPNAEEFYRRMGARCVGQVSYEIEGERRFLPLLHLRLDDLGISDS